MSNSSQTASESVAIISANPYFTLDTVVQFWEQNKIPVLLNPELFSEQVEDLCKRYSITSIIMEQADAKQNLEGSSVKVKRIRHTNLRTEHHWRKPVKIGGVKLLSSGSAGMSKLIHLSPDNLQAAYFSGKELLGYRSTDRWLLTLPLYHISGFSVFLRAIQSDASLFIPQSRKLPELIDAIETQKINLLSLVPTQLTEIANQGIKAPQTVKFALVGGAPCSVDILSAAVHLRWNPVKVYGSTETSAFVTALLPEEFPGRERSAGRPLNGVDVKILSDKNSSGKKIGKVCVKSASVSPDTNLERTDDGYLVMGDYGYLDEQGYLFITGRADTVLISGGEKIHIAEVEETLQSLAGIKAAVVFGIPDSRWGELVAAAIQPADGNLTMLQKEDLSALLKKNLISYKIPKRFFLATELMQTEVGKYDRGMIREKCLKGLFPEIHDF